MTRLKKGCSNISHREGAHALAVSKLVEFVEELVQECETLRWVTGEVVRVPPQMEDPATMCGVPSSGDQAAHLQGFQLAASGRIGPKECAGGDIAQPVLAPDLFPGKCRRWGESAVGVDEACYAAAKAVVVVGACMMAPRGLRTPKTGEAALAHRVRVPGVPLVAREYQTGQLESVKSGDGLCRSQVGPQFRLALAVLKAVEVRERVGRNFLPPGGGELPNQ